MTNFYILAGIVLVIVVSLGLGLEYLNRKNSKSKNHA
jgi:hypothetical protein